MSDEFQPEFADEFVVGPPVVSTESTSAALRRVEQERDEALAATRRWSDRYTEACRAGMKLQAELASARTELDITRRDLAVARHDTDMARNGRERLDRELTKTRTELDAVRTARDNLDRELAEARRLIDIHEQLEAVRDWIVARDGGRACVRCEQEIRRGEAYELLSGVDALRHIHCPIEPRSGTDG